MSPAITDVTVCLRNHHILSHRVNTKARGGRRESLLKFLLTYTAKSGFPEHHLIFPPSQLRHKVQLQWDLLRRNRDMVQMHVVKELQN